MIGRKRIKYCLVLGGGGARGVYHVGVWQALEKLGIEIEAVVGNSVGALIAGFVAQGQMKALEQDVFNLGLNDIIAIPKELVKDGEFFLDKKNFKVLLDYRKKVFKDKGFDTHPLTQTLQKYLDEKKIRSSNIDLGVITYRLDEMKPVEIFIDQMEEGTVLDYLKASATLPGFTVTKISDQQFIDGGVYNNIPFDMAKKRGYRNIILVDVSGIGINRRPDFKGTHSVYIKNSVNMGGVLDFNREFMERFARLGYLDTMRIFGRYRGWRYFIAEDRRIEKKLLALSETEEFLAFLHRLSFRKKIVDHSSTLQPVRSLLPDMMVHDKQWVYALLDCAAFIFECDRVAEYSADELMQQIYEKYLKSENAIVWLKENLNPKRITKMIGEIKSLALNHDFSALTQSSIYYYERLLEEFLGPIQKNVSFASFETLYDGVHAGLAGVKLVELYSRKYHR